MSITGIYND